jgi:multicomponent Na+:H+ antiporter subunit D
MSCFDLPPGWLLILGAAIIAPLPRQLRTWAAIALPCIALAQVITMAQGPSCTYDLFPGFGPVNFLRVDGLSRIFAIIFTLNAVAGMVFSMRDQSRLHHSASLAYIGSALGVVFAGDLVSLYLHWELMAVFSVLVILARKHRDSLKAAQRYFLVHVFGGLVLLAGILLHFKSSGSFAFDGFDYDTLGQSFPLWLMLAGILINAAAPPMGSWLPDAYPSASVTGGLILSAYTTKTAVYVLARGFAGWDPLMAIGCAMSVYGIIYALLENDMRRILAYSIINQVGFMVAGIGIGTAMALNGTAAHAFCHILYKSLLWMSAGAVLAQTGKSKCTELGGLYRSMPWTMVFGTIGALAISAVPLTNGFTSKTIILAAAEHEHLAWVWLILEAASAGVFLHAGIKFPYFVFFAKDRGLRPKEAPASMLLPMAALALLCILLGVYPEPLYRLLPFHMEAYNAYTPGHVMAQMQLLLFSALVFFLFLPMLKRTDTVSLDFDWFYRKGARLAYRTADTVLNTANRLTRQWVVGNAVTRFSAWAHQAPVQIAGSLACIAYRLEGCPDPEAKAERWKASLRLGTLQAGLGTALALTALLMLGCAALFAS